MAEWYETFFDALALDVWRDVVPEATTRGEAAFLLRHLAPDGAGPCRLLDVPCGAGRLSRPLAAAGHDVVGVDLSPVAVERAGEVAGVTEVAGVAGNVTVLAGDMRSLPAALAGQPPFDGACCMGNSFGYLNGPDTEAFAAGLAAALRPGGRFVLDAAIAAENVLTRLPDHDRYESEREGDGGGTLETVNSYDPLQSTMITHMTLEAGDRREQRVVRHRVMTCREIVQILEDGGLVTDDVLGGLDDEPFELGAERCLLVATRR